MIKEYLSLIRVKQYIKNFFIFLPAFFGFKLFDKGILLENIVAFIGFSLIASSIYVLNDILDYEKDKIHPTKKKRPIASGKISKRNAYYVMASCLILGFTFLLIFSNIQVVYFSLVYFVMNILYVLWVKHIGILDVFLISLGYVIRVYIGGVAGDIPITSWIIIMTFMLALFLGFAKRRDDVILMEKTGEKIRKSIDGYTLEFVDSVLFISSAITIIAYMMYTISPQTIEKYNSQYVYVTAIFVLLGIFRYLQITVALKESGSPTEVLYRDKILQLSIIGWVILFALIAYF